MSEHPEIALSRKNATNDLIETNKKLLEFIEDYLDDYEWDGYTPNRFERILINDAIQGIITDLAFCGLIHKAEQQRSLLADLPPEAPSVKHYGTPKDGFSDAYPHMSPTRNPSSNVKEVGHDGNGGLLVRFHDGKVYLWEGLADEHHDALLNADSPGRYIHSKMPKGKPFTE